MVEADKVEVYLVRHSDGTRFDEYTAPNGTLKHNGNANERWVEAVTDERFKIVVKLLRGFKFMGHPKVRVQFHMDRGDCFSITLSKKRPQAAPSSNWSHRETQLNRVLRFIDGQQMVCGLTFGELRTDETIGWSHEQNIEEADLNGRIIVKLRRGHFANRKAVRSGEVQSFDPPEHVDLDTSSKEVVRKHHVSHNLKHIILGLAQEIPEATGGYKREWVRAGGDGSEPIVFTFRYRSRESLQALQIITEDDEDGRTTVSDDTAGQNFNPSARPTMSPTPSQTPFMFSRTASQDLQPGLPSPRVMRSLLSNDDDDDDDDVHNGFGGRDEDQESPGKRKEHDGSDGDSDDDGSSPIGEFVGPGHATPLRDGDSSWNHVGAVSYRRDGTRSKPINVDDVVSDESGYTESEVRERDPTTNPRCEEDSTSMKSAFHSEQERKRAWSDVLQTEQELEAEEAAAALASEQRAKRRRELQTAKLNFLDLN